MSRGYGLFPFGVGSFGFGVEGATADPDAPDASPRALTSSGDLDPATRTTGARQAARIALGSTWGSSTVDREHGLAAPGFVTADYEARMRTAVQNALRPLIRSRRIQLRGVTVRVEGSRTVTHVQIYDLTTRASFEEIL